METNNGVVFNVNLILLEILSRVHIQRTLETFIL